MKEKKACISCKLNSCNYIYAFLLPFFCMILHIFQEKVIEETEYKILKFNLPLLFFYFFPKLLSLILLPIINILNKSESKEEEKNKVLRRYHFTIEKEKRSKILLLIYVISLLEVIYKADDSILMYLRKAKITDKLIEKRAGFIIFVPLFSYFILQKKLYRHHIFALILTIIGAIVFHINLIYFDRLDIVKDLIYHLINLFFSSFFSLSLVLIKYLMVKFFIISPYNFLLYDGLFCIINSLFCPLLEYYFVINIDDSKKMPNLHEENENYFRNNYLGILLMFRDKNWFFYFSFFLSFFASFGYFICNVFTIFCFTPYLNVLTDFLTPFLLYINDFIFNKKENHIGKNEFIIGFIGFIIVILGAVILNEIIILNFFGLNENTYSNISDRGRIDSFNNQELAPNAGNDDDDDDNNINEAEYELISNN